MFEIRFYLVPLLGQSKTLFRLSEQVLLVCVCEAVTSYANPEHVHFLVSRAPQLDEESLATIVANSSEKFINDNHLCVGIFQWQQSCSAFSVSKRHIDDLCKYIKNQKEHHKKRSYIEEYNGYVKFYQQTINKKTNEQ
jgi:REP element-mobilizing transposase RayT